MLKALEEKNIDQNVFVSGKRSQLLPTILSQCEIEIFKSGSKRDLLERLSKGWKSSQGRF